MRRDDETTIVIDHAAKVVVIGTSLLRIAEQVRKRTGAPIKVTATDKSGRPLWFDIRPDFSLLRRVQFLFKDPDQVARARERARGRLVQPSTKISAIAGEVSSDE